MLTKEECKMALNWLKGAICTECPRKYPIGFSKCIEEFSNTLQQLIEEHFELVGAMNHFSDEVMEYIEENRRLRENLDSLRDNPPLKFEELKEE